ncbi:hypothetical protein OSB04_004048 [Centaurea solstitialis]|uniref:Phosphatidate cytidylyltransferase n=1 Tax=Centaurea solstitialis TaxID=347529 RepID=A0AA38WNS6_9ASTR|nr:hypothetical protein OSB04_004048 [Centaurea solstitialis]
MGRVEIKSDQGSISLLTLLTATLLLTRSFLPWEEISVLPVQWHALCLGLFASVIAPFGGFFASGFKRAFKIKDFGGSIPGHGGFTDRMDCQMVMAIFAYIYHQSFVIPQYYPVEILLEQFTNWSQGPVLPLLKNQTHLPTTTTTTTTTADGTTTTSTTTKPPPLQPPSLPPPPHLPSPPSPPHPPSTETPLDCDCFVCYPNKNPSPQITFNSAIKPPFSSRPIEIHITKPPPHLPPPSPFLCACASDSSPSLTKINNYKRSNLLLPSIKAATSDSTAIVDGPTQASTSEEGEEEIPAKIGARVRVTVPEVELNGKEGKVKEYVALWKGKHISATFPYKIEFLGYGGGVAGDVAGTRQS